MDYTAVGDTINVAARVKQAAESIDRDRNDAPSCRRLATPDRCISSARQSGVHPRVTV
jgi:class 3 adenylate cyclase